VENRAIKLMALLLATITIYAIQSITNQLDEFEVPIEVKVDKGVAVLKQDAKTAYITCRGSLDDLRRLDVTQLRIVAAPKETGVAGGERVPIGPRNVQGWTRGVQIVKVRPGVVTVNFDREIAKQVGVAKPETVGEPLLGKAEIDYEPKIVTIRGPASKLVDRKILRTEPVDVDGAVDSFSKEVGILSEGESGVWEVEPAKVTVEVSIVTEAISKEWQGMKVVGMMDVDCGRDYTFSPQIVDVNLLGSPQAVNRISTGDISVFVDCVGIEEAGVHNVPAAVHLPPGVNLSAAVQPPVIEVTVTGRSVQKEPEVERVEEAAAPAPSSEEDPASE